MNALTTIPQYRENLPAYLRKPDFFQASIDAFGGIAGGAPPYISIKASKWRLVSADGQEQVVNQLQLDLVVLGGNLHVSKTYYASAYDPSAGAGVPPDCFSDNGKAPSSQAMTPQSALCSTCPHNAWGSKVSEITGKDLKACGDSKKLAVMLAKDTPIVVNGAAGVAPAFKQIYLLRVPAASMRGWKDYAKMVVDAGVPIPGVVIQASFDSNASYPALVFTTNSLTPYVDEASFTQRVMPALDGSAMRDAVGADDAPLSQGQPMPAAPAHLTLESQPASPASPASPPAPVAGFPASATASGSPPTTAAPTVSEAPRPRGRPRAGAQPSQPPAQQMANPVQQQALVPGESPFNQQALAPQQNGAIQQAAAASPDLDALLAKTFG